MTAKTANTTKPLTIEEYRNTENGSGLLKLLDEYRGRGSIDAGDALEYLCVSEIYFCLFEGSINPSYTLPEKFQEVPAESAMKSIVGWAHSDYCADILTCSNEDSRLCEFENCINGIVEDYENGGGNNDGRIRKFLVTHIEWDIPESCDGSYPLLPKNLGIPEWDDSVEVEIRADDDAEVDREIKEWLFDTFGYRALSYDKRECADSDLSLPVMYLIVRSNEIGGVAIIGKHRTFDEAASHLRVVYDTMLESGEYEEGVDCTPYTDENGRTVAFDFNGDEAGIVYVQIVKC